MEDEQEQVYIKYGKDIEKSITPSLRKYDLPEDVIDSADYHYRIRDYRITRQKKRILLYYYCSLRAYRDMYGTVDPNYVRKKFDISQGATMKATSLFSDKNISEVIYTSAVDLIPEYCQQLKLNQEVIEDIVLLGQSIIDKAPTLKNDSPQTVAAGIIWYHLTTIGVEQDKRKFSSIVDRTPATIKKMVSRVTIIDNCL
jgi:transcription initiation factor TFIIIB Brf1 subunit/transcription initiation factor TFIIB